MRECRLSLGVCNASALTGLDRISYRTPWGGAGDAFGCSELLQPQRLRRKRVHGFQQFLHTHQEVASMYVRIAIIGSLVVMLSSAWNSTLAGPPGSFGGGAPGSYGGGGRAGSPAASPRGAYGSPGAGGSSRAYEPPGAFDSGTATNPPGSFKPRDASNPPGSYESRDSVTPGSGPDAR